MFGIPIFTAAFVVWIIGWALHYHKGIEPGKNWCLVMAICAAVMSFGNILGLLMGSLISGLLLLWTIPTTIQYYRMWQIKKSGW